MKQKDYERFLAEKKKEYNQYRNRKIVELRDKYGLTFAAIAERFSLSSPVVARDIYVRAKNEQNQKEKKN